MDKVSKYFWLISALIIIGIILLPLVWWLRVIIFFLTYVLVVFVLSRLLVTAFGFRKKPLPKRLSKDLQKTVDSITGSTEQRLEKAFHIITKKFYGESGKTYVRLGQLFWSDIGKEWEKGGYANCTKINYFFRLLLVKSKTVSDDQIKLHAVMYRYNIHQYIEIATEKGVMVFDLAFDYADIPFARKNDGWWNRHFKPERYDGLYLKKR